MSALSSEPPSSSGADVSPRFCAARSIDLAFFIKPSWLEDGDLAVTDADGNVVFTVESRHAWSRRSRHVILDRSGKPVVSMKQKLRSLHDRWKIYVGDSSYRKDLMFTARRNSLLDITTELNVFLAGNAREEVCDYKIKGSYLKKSCTIFKGDSSEVVAQMSKEYKFVTNTLSKHAFGVAVKPNMDCSVVAALVVILRALHKGGEDDDGAASGRKAGP